ncbi:MAG TPA: NAD(P)-binding domain-containing protein [Actinomycetota bacterium]|nr:NAD(P)-binding domain-containing protein [Actinomycetota bacterium]
MAEDITTVVVGAGQAGLATSHELSAAGVEHVVLDRGRIGETWRGRWDSFCLVTPNWTVQLPGGRYEGDDPDGYLPRDDIVGHLATWAKGFDAPVREGVDVRSLDRSDDGTFALETSSGRIRARAAVLATGAYQRAFRPAAAADLPEDLFAVDVEGYRNPEDLPPGRVLVVGSGQSGCQIAEELHQAGRDVVLSCGRAPWVPRRMGGRDIVWWVLNSGFLDAPVESLPSEEAKLWANFQASGHDGGHDLHARTLRAMGVTLVGRFVGVDDHGARFAQDLRESVAWGDERFEQLMDLFRKVVAEHGLEPPEYPQSGPIGEEGPEHVDLRDVGAVVFAGGFRPDYRSWVRIPDAFDTMGFPLQKDGTSTVVPNLHFIGVHFMRKRKSTLLVGVGEDAEIVARAVAQG